MFSESQIIHECNRAPILLTDAVATEFSGCIHHFSMWGQSCTYHAEVYSPVLPQVLIQCMLIVTILHMRSNLMVSEWLRLTEHTHPENSTLAEVSAMQHLGQKTTLLMHAVITHLQFCCPEGSWAAPPKSLLHHWLSLCLGNLHLSRMWWASNHNMTSRTSRAEWATTTFTFLTDCRLRMPNPDLTHV